MTLAFPLRVRAAKIAQYNTVGGGGGTALCWRIEQPVVSYNRPTYDRLTSARKWSNCNCNRAIAIAMRAGRSNRSECCCMAFDGALRTEVDGSFGAFNESVRFESRKCPENGAHENHCKFNMRFTFSSIGHF